MKTLLEQHITTCNIFYTIPTDFKNDTQMISELVLQHFLNETGMCEKHLRFTNLWAFDQVIDTHLYLIKL